MKTYIMRTLVVDDQSLVCSGICRSISDLHYINVVGKTTSGKEAIALCAALKPDLVLLDLNLPDMEGLEIISGLLEKVPSVRILIVTSSLDASAITQLFASGVSGFFNKVDGYEELAKAIYAVSSGHIYICPWMAKKMHPDAHHSSINPFDLLSERELQIVLLLCAGFTLEEACPILKSHASTTKTHRLRIFEKLSVRNDVELILVAMRYGFINESHL